MHKPQIQQSLWIAGLIAAGLAGCGDRLNSLCKSWDAAKCESCSPDSATVTWRRAEGSPDASAGEVISAAPGIADPPSPPIDRQSRSGSTQPTLAVYEEGATKEPQSSPRKSQQPDNVAHRLAAGDYRVAPGDQLELLFHESWPSEAAYRLLAGDEIRVEFVSQPNGLDGVAGLDRTLRIQPDGKVVLPFLGFVQAAGLTPGDLANELTRRYSDLYVDPQVLVTLVSTGRGLRDLRESMKAAGGRTAVVAPDGTIRMPHIGMTSVADLTLREIEDELNERYRRAVPGFHVTVRLADGS